MNWKDIQWSFPTNSSNFPVLYIYSSYLQYTVYLTKHVYHFVQIT